MSAVPLEEYCVVAASLAGLWLALTADATAAQHPRLRAIFAILALTLLVWQLWFRGLHWQLFPALLVLAGSTLCLLFSWTPRHTTPFAILSGALCTLSIVAATLLPLFRLPPPTGPHRVGARTVYFTDPRTHRQLVTQLWYPTDSVNGQHARYGRPAELPLRFVYQAWIRTDSLLDAPLEPGPHPLLLFSHMWGGRRTQDTFLVEDLASHGYVVAAVDHPGNATRVQLQDGSVVRGGQSGSLDTITSSPTGEQLWNDELAVWARDDRFTLASLAALSATPGSWLHGRLDLSRVGALGHSFGGAASLDLLGHTAFPDSDLPAPVPTVQAAVNMDGWTFAGLDHRTGGQDVLFLYGIGLHATGAAPAGDSIEDRMQRTDQAIVQQTLQRFGGTRAWLHGAQHKDFTDVTLFSPLQRLTYTGPISGIRARTVVRGLVLAYFNRTLLRQAVPLPAYPELQIESHPDPATARIAELLP